MGFRSVRVCAAGARLPSRGLCRQAMLPIINVFETERKRFCEKKYAGPGSRGEAGTGMPVPYGWNKEMPATPAAPAARQSGAFCEVTPPSANTGMETPAAASRNASRPSGAP